MPPHPPIPLRHSVSLCVPQVVSSVRNGGTAIIYGAMSGLTMTVAIPDVLFRGVNIRGFWLSPWTKS